MLLVVVAAAAAAAQGLTPAEQEAFAALVRAAEAVERADDRIALIQAAAQLSTAARQALNAFDAADGEREAAAAAYRAAVRAAQASTVTCANGYPCTNNRLDPFEGIARALAEHLQRIAGVSFATAVYVETVGVAGAEEARERGGRLRQMAAGMGRYARRSPRPTRCTTGRPPRPRQTGAPCSTTCTGWWKPFAAAAIRAPGDLASRAVMGDVQDRLVALRARLSTVAQPADADAADDEVARVSDLATTGGGSSEEAETGATTEAGVADALAALDRAFETQGAAQDDARPAEAGVADALAALDRAFETQGAAQDDAAGAADDADEPEPADLAAWVRAVNAGVRRAEEAARAAEAAAASGGSWFSRMAACVDAHDRLESAVERAEALTLGATRPAFVTTAAGAEAYAEVEARLDAAREDGRMACESIEQP